MVRMFLPKLQCELPDSCGAQVPPCPRPSLAMLILTSAPDCLSQDIGRWTARTSVLPMLLLIPTRGLAQNHPCRLSSKGPFLAPEPSQELWSLHYLTDWFPWFLLAFNWPRFQRYHALCPENDFSEYIPNRLWPSQSSGSQHLSFFSRWVPLSLYLTRCIFSELHTWALGVSKPHH